MTGRPKKIDKRKKRIHVCFSDEEHERLVTQAKNRGLNISEMVRFDILNVRPTKKVATPVREQLIRGISSLQQISKNIDALHGSVSDEILMMVRTEIMAARQLITKAL